MSRVHEQDEIETLRRAEHAIAQRVRGHHRCLSETVELELPVEVAGWLLAVLERVGPGLAPYRGIEYRGNLIRHHLRCALLYGAPEPLAEHWANYRELMRGHIDLAPNDGMAF